ncbi:MAG: hypothetical protein A3J55_01310 [Candidatus Ryanbacteria bacterium RIFCSPHIGHO2_02_FULL_45_17b]|uniref:Uncharacterized protein n=1 Tax=Candidatus Ryanbacteria bacterium RIFCSPHIGHO2_01_FULL_45_22 TaxID=1802114 RepID=A0A1G2G2C5_9BACT|nr:MAG: hypothetical protein A2719_03780 [Candidatus Ryanbacteria bacterium RIFCSPHIGHO2_01_FULL_45_22]OGZ47172.1 MAG: hypothetical protein A3J55_01310 [Candidatus Ryanbacteria bacterium RIFCSPHIGHO2_02_FULL_45_17b]
MYVRMFYIVLLVLTSTIFGGIGWRIGGSTGCAIGVAVSFVSTLLALGLCAVAGDERPLLNKQEKQT